MNPDDFDLDSFCSEFLEVHSIFVNHTICEHCEKKFMFADGTFGISETKSLICCPYCNTYDIRSCDLREAFAKRNLFWK